MNRIRFAAALVPVALAAGSVAVLSQVPPGPTVKAVLELGQQFLYAGDPLHVRLSIGNEGGVAAPNPVRTPLFQGFRVRAEAGPLAAQEQHGLQEPARPDRLAPGSFYGSIAEISRIFPGLLQPGRYEISWSADGVSSNVLLVQILPKYDPAKAYTARVETDQGGFTVEFLPKVSPVAVKAFIDLARAGYYDGLLIHEVRPDQLVAGGEPEASGQERPPFGFPQEQSPTPVIAGTVLMRPVGAAPPAHGAGVFVTLRPEPALTGQVTVVGQVVEGLEILRRISKVPSNETAARPHYKPLKDIRILRVEIREKPPASAP